MFTGIECRIVMGRRFLVKDTFYVRRKEKPCRRCTIHNRLDKVCTKRLRKVHPSPSCSVTVADNHHQADDSPQSKQADQYPPTKHLASPYQKYGREWHDQPESDADDVVSSRQKREIANRDTYIQGDTRKNDTESLNTHPTTAYRSPSDVFWICHVNHPQSTRIESVNIQRVAHHR